MKHATQKTHPTKTPKLRFPEFDGAWEEKRLGEIGSIVSGLTYSPSDIHEDGVLVLRSSNIQNGRLSFKDNVYVNISDGFFNPVKENDILICVRNGSKALIGKNTLIDKKSSGVAFGAFMAVYRSDSNIYLCHFFKSNSYKKQVYKNLGATINSINGSDLKKFKLSLPPLPEQQKIANFLTATDTWIENLRTQKQTLETYKKGIMQKIVRPQITVTRDSGCNVKTLKKLEARGLIQLVDVDMENGKENKKIKNKVAPVGVWDVSNWGDGSVWGNSTDGKFDELKKIIGKQHIQDIRQLEAHVRSKNEIFVTEDKDDILSKAKELKKIGITVLSPEALTEYCNTHILRFLNKNGKPFLAWEEKRLGEVGEITGGGTPDTTKKEYWNGDIDWFTPTEIKLKYAISSQRKITKEGLKKSSTKLLPVGALLFTSRATIGEVSISKRDCVTNQGLQSIIVNKKNDNNFIYYWIKRNKQIFLRKASGSTFLEISRKSLCDIKDVFPSLPEQEKIANFLTSLDNQIDAKQDQIKKAEEWKRGVMQGLFV